MGFQVKIFLESFIYHNIRYTQKIMATKLYSKS